MSTNKPTKTSREALLERVIGNLKVDRRTAETIVDRVLEATNAFAWPYLENEWGGGELLHQIRMWRGGR